MYLKSKTFHESNIWNGRTFLAKKYHLMTKNDQVMFLVIRLDRLEIFIIKVLALIIKLCSLTALESKKDNTTIKYTL